MSTGLECQFFETKGDWFYLLEDWDSPRGACDWRDQCTPYGPFGTFDIAHQHLHDNHANPGGCSITEFGVSPLDEIYAKLVEQARS